MSKVPEYYVGKSGRPAWDFIDDFGLGYYRGCALKYIARAGRKTPDPRKDLRKAIHCLERELELAEAKAQKSVRQDGSMHGWWCTNCGRFLGVFELTADEFHYGCGGVAVWCKNSQAAEGGEDDSKDK